MEKTKQLINSIKYSFKIIYDSSRMLIIPYIMLCIINSTLPLVNLYFFNLILNDISAKHSLMEIIPIIIIYISFIFINYIVTCFQNIIYYSVIQKSGNRFEILLSEKLSRLSLSFIDSSNGKDIVDDIRYLKDIVCNLPFRIIRIFTQVYTCIASFIVIMKFNVLMSLIFIVFTVPGILINHFVERKNDNLRVESAPDIRKFSYYRWMLTDIWPAMDVRMYDLTEPLKKRYDQERKKYIKKKNKVDLKTLYLSLISAVIEHLGLMIFTFFIVIKAIYGQIQIGEIALYLGMASKAIYSFRASSNSYIYVYTIYTEKFIKIKNFFNLEENEQKEGKGYRLEDFSKIEFKDVYFKYPLTDEFVLKGASFVIEKGEKISLIGINGAGKSTIVKLLLCLYKINSGEILIDGKSIYSYNIDDVHKLFSVLFQNFVKYPLTLRENITLSNVDYMEDDSKILDAMKKSGAYENLGKFKDDLDTYMTRQFDDKGVELSKGQWQKIALARTYFKESKIVIFDEPSAALDPEAEDKIFSNFEKLSSDRTGIMISHRISSARMSSKIIVLNNGIVEECGSHDKLIKQKGLYSKLYQLQMEKYSVKKGQL